MLLSDQHPRSKDNKFHGRRLLSDEISATNSSFGIYYGVAPGSVPFLWESQPGTPKHASSEAAASLRPLAPPPSHFSATSAVVNKPPLPIVAGFIRAVLPRLQRPWKDDAWAPTSSVSSYSSSRSSSSYSSRSGDCRCFASSLLSCAGSGGKGDDDSDGGSPTSTLFLPAPPKRTALPAIVDGSGRGAAR